MFFNTFRYLFVCFCIYCFPISASIFVGVGQSEMIAPEGVPSAGYVVSERKMEGTHDPLLVTALVLKFEEKSIALCAVDHLGFDQKMVEEIKEQLPGMEVVIASSHTHSGIGAYLNIPIIGEMLAGPFDQKVRNMLIEQTIQTIKKANVELQEAKIGIGYGKVQGLNVFRSSWPTERQPPEEITVIQCISKDNETLALLFNFAMHPTVLSSKNTFFSADFVGCARQKIQETLGGKALFFNGAQGDVGPKSMLGKEEYENCQLLGEALADAVIDVAESIVFQEECTCSFLHYPYTFNVKPTSSGLQLPMSTYHSELNVLLLNQEHAFVTVPGELSCLYLDNLNAHSPFVHTSVWGLVNDAHGYILSSEAFEYKTKESQFSFGGAEYGDWMVKQLLSMLHSEELSQ